MIQFGTLPEIPINVVYILLEEYRRQPDMVEWNDEDLDERFKGIGDHLMALDKLTWKQKSAKSRVS